MESVWIIYKRLMIYGIPYPTFYELVVQLFCVASFRCANFKNFDFRRVDEHTQTLRSRYLPDFHYLCSIR